MTMYYCKATFPCEHRNKVYDRDGYPDMWREMEACTGYIMTNMATCSAIQTQGKWVSKDGTPAWDRNEFIMVDPESSK